MGKKMIKGPKWSKDQGDGKDQKAQGINWIVKDQRI